MKEKNEGYDNAKELASYLLARLEESEEMWRDLGNAIAVSIVK